MLSTDAPAKLAKRHTLLVVPFLLGQVVACGNDDPEPGYYLRGRVFNGENQESIAKAELTLLSGQETHHATSAEDGTFKLGPIEPSASYRVSAEAKGMGAFEFTGLALPALDAQAERTVIGDVPLFEKSKPAPAFKIVVRSSDPRVPAAVSSVEFAATVVGTDPAFVEPTAADPDAGALAAASDEESVMSGTVVGAYAVAAGASLPNHANAGAKSFQISTTAGEAEIPEAALTWGASYEVSVDAGPDFVPAVFMLTAVRGDEILVVLDTSSELPSNQLSQNAQQYFTGRIYDGVTQARLTDYQMRLEYFDRVIDGVVDASGRYIIGPLLPNADYTIAVEAEGYRSFLSHNEKFVANNNTPVTSLYYDAFLYPVGVQAPAVDVRFSLANNGELPTGTVRFSPRSSSNLFDDDAETPAGVNRQVWKNDEDLQQRAVVREFAEGQLSMPEGEFVLGVEYAVSVFGVENYAILSNGTFHAGIDTNPTFTLQPVQEQPLAVVSVWSDKPALSANGSVEIRFNHPIVAFPRVDQEQVLRQLNDAFSISAPDLDADATVNTLVDSASLTSPISPSYRGVSLEISGDRLTLSWDRERGLETSDTGDPIVRVTYAGLAAVMLYTGTLPTSPAQSLAQLLGGNASLEAQLVAQ
jgi:hypothetical protein